MAICENCETSYPDARAKLGYKVCLGCGDEAAAEERKGWTVAPMHKSNYVLVTDPSILEGVNNKGGNVR